MASLCAYDPFLRLVSANVREKSRSFFLQCVFVWICYLLARAFQPFQHLLTTSVRILHISMFHFYLICVLDDIFFFISVYFAVFLFSFISSGFDVWFAELSPLGCGSSIYPDFLA